MVTGIAALDPTIETPAETAIDASSGKSPKKKLIRRLAKDHSQRIRFSVQAAFVLLNTWLCVQFYFWVRYFETGGTSRWVPRPAGVEGWLPIAGLMNLKFFLLTHQIPPVHPAAMFLLATFLVMSLLLKKAFCSWLCPIGTFSEILWKLGRTIFKTNLTLPWWIDIPLRGLKYLLLSFFVFVIGRMSAEMLLDFMQQPYGIIADVRMLNFFRHIGETGAIVIGVLVVASVIVQNFWCRYLCPYGALMGIAALLSPIKIRRDVETCIDCAKCAKACPSQLPVDRLVQISSAECTACMSCVAACPAENALQFALPSRKATEYEERWYARVVRPWAVAALIAFIFFGVVGYAKLAGHWKRDAQPHIYMQLVPQADQESHPGM
jgi:polyferredoxin